MSCAREGRGVISTLMKVAHVLASTVFASLVLVTGARAQEAKVDLPKVELPAPSPLCTSTQRVGLTTVEVTYSRPSAKGRKVYGEVVPFGKLWRTGANASTKVSFSTDVKLEGQAVPAGKYALYTIPTESEWTIILNKDLTVPVNKYDEKQDQLRFKVKAAPLADAVESFRIEVQDIKDESASLVLDWEKTRVAVKLEVEVMSKVMPQIDAAMDPKHEQPAILYFQCAMFYINHDQDQAKALAWVEKGLAQKSDYRWLLLHAKAKLLAKKGDKAGATAAATESSELALKAEGLGGPFQRMNAEIISSLK